MEAYCHFNSDACVVRSGASQCTDYTSCFNQKLGPEEYGKIQKVQNNYVTTARTTTGFLMEFHWSAISVRDLSWIACYVWTPMHVIWYIQQLLVVFYFAKKETKKDPKYLVLRIISHILIASS